ncbi:MAG: adenosylmethionine decarboxylase [Planctomycetes bacterium]|nr:adenosylmethionine decarboxylase [Planctomycetota bacterium]
MSTVGTHCLIELHGCPAESLNDQEFVRRALRDAVQAGGATLLEEVTHQFHPHGVTVLALLAESHLAIHTWPEHAYVAADMFTCGRRAQPERACLCLARAFRAQRHTLTTLPRGPRKHAVIPP